WDLYEKGSSTDRSFYQNYLKAVYINDAPEGSNATYYSMTSVPVMGTALGGSGPITFDNGSHGTFDVDWPDAIAPNGGSEMFMTYTNVDTGLFGGAGVAFVGHFPNSKNADFGVVVYLAVPFETIYPQEKREELMADIIRYFNIFVDSDVSAPSGLEDIPNSFSLLQNYPNPFNAGTTIEYQLPSGGTVDLTIFNIQGEEVWQTHHAHATGGVYTLQWFGENKAGLKVSSGVYFYKVQFASSSGKVYRQTRRMSFLK
ncbi:T9SS type A sorting domain-containing protein, partial [candidate division KSB1 bacterium]|nr:T9SS type A sorting domain-containing protein [candidate division KSB1 bacterium]